MENTKLAKFLDEKQKFQKSGHKLFFMFEARYIEENKELYSKKLENFEERLENIQENTPADIGKFLMCAFERKKFEEDVIGIKMIHVASNEGFPDKENIAYIQQEHTTQAKKMTSETFIQAFQQIVANKKIIPDKSCILVSSEDHHMMLSKSLTDSNSTPTRRRLERQSKLRGQKIMTDFFHSKKHSSITRVKPVQQQPKYKIEDITSAIRGDDVKILWIPKSHYELDPSRFVSVFLLNEVSHRLIATEDPDLKVCCLEAFKNLPDGIWKLAADYLDQCSEFYCYKKENEDEN